MEKEKISLENESSKESLNGDENESHSFEEEPKKSEFVSISFAKNKIDSEKNETILTKKNLKQKEKIVDELSSDLDKLHETKLKLMSSVENPPENFYSGFDLIFQTKKELKPLKKEILSAEKALEQRIQELEVAFIQLQSVEKQGKSLPEGAELRIMYELPPPPEVNLFDLVNIEEKVKSLLEMHNQSKFQEDELISFEQDKKNTELRTLLNHSYKTMENVSSQFQQLRDMIKQRDEEIVQKEEEINGLKNMLRESNGFDVAQFSHEIDVLKKENFDQKNMIESLTKKVSELDEKNYSLITAASDDVVEKASEISAEMSDAGEMKKEDLKKEVVILREQVYILKKRTPNAESVSNKSIEDLEKSLEKKQQKFSQLQAQFNANDNEIKQYLTKLNEAKLFVEENKAGSKGKSSQGKKKIYEKKTAPKKGISDDSYSNEKSDGVLFGKNIKKNKSTKSENVEKKKRKKKQKKSEAGSDLFEKRSKPKTSIKPYDSFEHVKFSTKRPINRENSKPKKVVTNVKSDDTETRETLIHSDHYKITRRKRSLKARKNTNQ